MADLKKLSARLRAQAQHPQAVGRAAMLEAADALDLLAGRMTVEGMARALAHQLHPYVGGDTPAIAWAHVKARGEADQYLDAATALISYLTGGDESKDNSSS